MKTWTEISGRSKPQMQPGLILTGDFDLVGTVLKGIAKGYPKCCVEFYARCIAAGVDPCEHGGGRDPQSELIKCPMCCMSVEEIEAEIQYRKETTPTFEALPGVNQLESRFLESLNEWQRRLALSKLESI